MTQIHTGQEGGAPAECVCVCVCLRGEYSNINCGTSLLWTAETVLIKGGVLISGVVLYTLYSGVILEGSQCIYMYDNRNYCTH